MRFALFGNHPDGVDLAEALAGSGHHELVAYTRDDPRLHRLGPKARKVGDVEEILADPSVDAVIVADSVGARSQQLRRALQSERHVLCVHPAGDGPEIAYEAAMMRDDVKCILLPILNDGRHPAIRRLREFVHRGESAKQDSPVGEFLLLKAEWPGIRETEESAAFPGWDILRTVGGDIAELSAFAASEEAVPGEPAVLTGSFEHGGLFQVSLLPAGADDSWLLTVAGRAGRVELQFPTGIAGPAFLNWRDASGQDQEEYWDAWDACPSLIEAFEAAVSNQPPAISWQDEVRALELDDAARRSLSKRRTSLLEYQEATEEVGFKGTMTLVGCALLWVVLLLVVLTAWVPWLRWVIMPLIVVFLGLQLLRYALPKRPS
jgi:predicted dehydrogenase